MADCLSATLRRYPVHLLLNDSLFAGSARYKQPNEIAKFALVEPRTHALRDTLIGVRIQVLAM
jgi:hypothetical protein